MSLGSLGEDFCLEIDTSDVTVAVESSQNSIHVHCQVSTLSCFLSRAIPYLVGGSSRRAAR